MTSAKDRQSGLSCSRSLRILLVNTRTQGGGAENVVRLLDRSLELEDFESHLVAGEAEGEAALLLPNRTNRTWVAQHLLRASQKALDHRGRTIGAGTVSRLLAWLAEPVRNTRKRLGHEDFYFPGTQRLLEMTPSPVDLVHFHNLHGDYFDLRQLPAISNRVPTAVTLHDQWLMTGHCAYSLECERWRHECGNCPHLDTYPAIPRDATKGNLTRKQTIYRKSRLYMSAPSQWLLDQIPLSVLAPAAVREPRLIPNGVDQSVFNPLRRAESRAQLNLPDESIVVTFAANLALSNPYKDWGTLSEALSLIGQRTSKRIFAFAIGEKGRRVQQGRVTVQPIERVTDPNDMARWYRASDIYLQPSRADNHPLTVLESLSSGTPVVAAAVGGIPEQVRPLASIPGAVQGRSTLANATGVLVPVTDPEALAQCVNALIERPENLAQMGANAARDAAKRFSWDRYVSDTLRWYRDILQWEKQTMVDTEGPTAATEGQL